MGAEFRHVILCYLAAVAAGSTDGRGDGRCAARRHQARGEKYTFEELPEAIEALQNGDDIDYEGAGGAIELDDAGDPQRC